MKHVVFCDNSKSKTLPTTPFGSCIPFGIIHSHSSAISGALFAFNYALFFGFDLYYFGSDLVVLGSISDKKVWNIDGLFATEWIEIRNAYAFTGPLKYVVVVITKCHKSKLPS